MNNYIFTSSLKFEENCNALPAYCRPSVAQIAEWNRLAAAEVRRSCASALPERQYYAWIGINPPPATLTMKELWEKALATMPYDNYEISVEQHTDGGLRPHLHCVAKVTANTRPKKEIVRLQKIYSLENHFIQYKIFHCPLLLAARQKYIRGEKVDKKVLHTEGDRVDRLVLKIPNFLSIGKL